LAKQYDVIVIGAGNGGMIAACTLSQMGFRTLLVEKNSSPGGCAASFVRGRFEFEAALHNLPGVGEGIAAGDIGMLFNRFGVKRSYYPIPDSLHFIVEGENRVEFCAYVGRENFVREAERLCPGCADSFWRFCDLCDELNRALEYLSGCKGRPDMEYLGKNHPNYLRMASSSVTEMFEALDMPQGLRDILGVFAMYQCGNVDEIDAARYTLMADSFIQSGAFQTDLRSYGLSVALTESARKMGCDVWYNTEVSEISVENGAATGIVTADGRTVRAGYVLCNIMPHIVYGKLIRPELAPPMELKTANARTLGARGFSVYLGLNRSAAELGIKDYAFFLNTTTSNPTQVKNCATMEYDDLCANCLNIMVPDASPEGTCIVYLTNMFSGDAFSEVTPENYRQMKTDYAKRLIARYEKALGISLSPYIEEVVIASPVTFARYLGTPQGAVFGYYPGDWDGMMSRTMADSAGPGIRGLDFIGGHGVRLSGFAPSYMSGFLGAMKAAGIMRGGARP